MSIVADKIAARAVTLEKLDFTPVQSSNVVASINASAEGLTINTAKLNLTGVLQVGGAAADINAGTTTINGGKIQTDTLVAGSITADKITVAGTRLDAHWMAGSVSAMGTIEHTVGNAPAWSGTPKNFGTVGFFPGSVQILAAYFNPTNLMGDSAYQVFVQPIQIDNPGGAVYVDWRLTLRESGRVNIQGYSNTGTVLNLDYFNWKIDIMALRRA